MPVWSEPGRQYNTTAPGGAQVTGSLATCNWMREYSSAQSAALSLATLASDALAQITLHYNAGDTAPGNAPLIGSRLDGPELVNLLIYLGEVAFESVRLEAETGGAAGSTPYNAFTTNMQLMLGSAFSAYAHLRGVDVPAVMGDPELVVYRAELANTFGAATAATAAPQQTGLGTVELLCRIAANNCQNLGTILTRLQGLQLTQLSATAVAGNAYRGLAKTVFVCAGSNGAVVGAEPTAVITTSQDNWGGFKVLQKWAERCRNDARRLDWVNRLDPALRDHDKVRAHSRRLFTRYETAAGLLAQPTTSTTRSAARQAVIAQARNAPHGPDGPPGPHEHEHAVPLFCPAFQPRGRCLRCQALFNYDIQQAAIPDETLLQGRAKLVFFKELSCAECIAHYACNNAMLTAPILVGGLAGNLSH